MTEPRGRQSRLTRGRRINPRIRAISGCVCQRTSPRAMSSPCGEPRPKRAPRQCRRWSRCEGR
eukprot:2143060-Rhodomonas_salina.1